MSALKRTQEWLVDAITATEDSATVEQFVLPSAKQTANDRLHVYRHAYVARLIECLADDYPATFHALGADRADELARAYIEAHPSRSFSLNAYSQHMPAFLRAQAEPFAADLATLEWSLVEAIHAAESPKLAPNALAGVSPDDFAHVALTASPSLRLHAFDYPVNAYYQSFQQEESPQIPAPEASWLAIYRVDMKVWRLSLTRGMYALLAPLARGASLEEAFEADVGDEADVAAWFQQWTSEGLFAGVTRKA